MKYQLAIFAAFSRLDAYPSRLAPSLDNSILQRLLLAFLADTIRKAVMVAERPVVYCTEDVRMVQHGLRVNFDLQPGVDWIQDQPGDTGTRLARVPTPAIIIPANTPAIPVDFLRQAVDGLSYDDVVLGPAIDGGFYLIGLSGDTPRIFDSIPWGTQDVLNQVRERALAMGLPPRLLPPWYDIDTADDLKRLQIDLDTLPAGIADDCPYTRSLLQDTII